MDDRPDPDPDRPDPADLSRSDMRTLRGALRNDWPIPDDVKQRLLQSLINLADPDTVEGAMAGSRSRISAAKTLALFAGLTLAQAKLDLARERLEGRNKAEGSLADAVAEAERLAEERGRERSGGG